MHSMQHVVAAHLGTSRTACIYCAAHWHTPYSSAKQAAETACHVSAVEDSKKRACQNSMP